MVKHYIPEQGDIVFVSFDPTRGHEQSGFRPALVISNSAFNEETNFFTCCPITSEEKGYRFELLFAGKKVSGTILCNQPRTLDIASRKPQFIEKIDETTLKRVKGVVISIIE